MNRHCIFVIIVLFIGLTASLGALDKAAYLPSTANNGTELTTQQNYPQRTEYTAPYLQNFNSITWPPADWYDYGTNPDLYWSPLSNWARCNFSIATPGAIANLVSPWITIPGAQYRLDFKWSHYFSADMPYDIGRVKIFDINSSHQTWVMVWEKTLAAFNSNDGAGISNPGSGVTESLDLSAYNGHQIQVMFEGTSGWGPGQWFVDDFNIHYVNNSVSTFPLTQDFSNTTFPPTNWVSPFMPPQWSRAASNGYGATGSGSATPPFNYPSGTNIDLSTPYLNLGAFGGRLSFDHAYANYLYAPDRHSDLEILYSTNGGETLNHLVTYSGAPDGDLVTAPTYTSTWWPGSDQWASKTVQLPAGTNKVVFRAVSDYTGDLYLDNVRIEKKYFPGSGTAADPYQISSPADLNNIRQYLGTTYAGRCFKLMNNIDMLSYLSIGGEGYTMWGNNGWLPLGDATNSFYGNFDGNNCTINNLRTAYYGSYHGLFGYTAAGSKVSNLNLGSTCYTLGDGETGSIVGHNGGTVRNCSSAASVRIGNAEKGGGIVGSNIGTISQSSFSGSITRSGGGVSCNKIGGIAGNNETGAVVDSCYSTGSVAGNTWCGGLVGWNNGTINRCYTTGTITGAGYSIGGLVGQHNGSITNSYSRANVSGASYIGGLIGHTQGSTIINSYSTGTVSGGQRGGLCGQPGATITSSYWDTQSSGIATSYGGTGKTTAQMQQQSTFTGWDFAGETANGSNDYWNILSYINEGYPFLSWEYSASELISFSAGTGTAADPFQITTPAELNIVRRYLGAANAGKYFKLMNDIDLTAYLASGEGFTSWGDSGWLPIGSAASPFYGQFDGNGKVVWNLIINRFDTDNVGLFGYTAAGSSINHLGIDRDWSVIRGGDAVGTLVGKNYGTISYCYVNGGVQGTTKAGLLAGWNLGTITKSFTTGYCENDGSTYGGVVGQNEGTISYCYSLATVQGADYIGGLVGNNVSGTVNFCYNSGEISTWGDHLGGIVGANTGNVFNSYWNTETTWCPTSPGSDGSYGITTVQMQIQSTFIGWDFDTIWFMSPAANNGFPQLTGNTPQPLTSPTNVSIHIGSVSGTVTLTWNNNQSAWYGVYHSGLGLQSDTYLGWTNTNSVTLPVSTHGFYFITSGVGDHAGSQLPAGN